jgi:oligoribonuclease
MRQHIDRVKAMTETTLSKSENNLIWIDLEMTGLKPESDRIIEIAVVVTDPLLTVRVEGPVFAIHQSDATLDAMDAWNKGTHGKSGLIDGSRPPPSTRPRPKPG